MSTLPSAALHLLAGALLLPALGCASSDRSGPSIGTDAAAMSDASTADAARDGGALDAGLDGGGGDAGPNDGGGGDAAAGDGGLSPAAELEETRNDIIRTACACDFSPFASEDDCALDARSPDVIGCYVTGTEPVSTELSPWLSCQLEAQRDYVTCLGAAACDEAALQSCSDGFEMAAGACPDPDETALATRDEGVTECVVGTASGCPDGAPAVSTLGDAVFSGSTFAGGDDHDGICGSSERGGAPDRSFAWQAPADGTYVVDTHGSSYDTVLFVLDGCGGTLLGCSDDHIEASTTLYLTSQVELTLSAGETVLIVVDGYFGSTPTAGEFVVNIHEVPVTPVINEFVLNHAGADTHEYMEVFAAPSTDYSSLSLVVLDGDGPEAGRVEWVVAVGTTDASGLWRTPFTADVLENGTSTLFLVDGFTGAVGDDLDAADDGTLDSAPWASVVDDVSVDDGGTGDHAYAGVTLTPTFDGAGVTVGGASRLPDGTSTGSPSDWGRNDFDGAGLEGETGWTGTGTPAAGEALNTPGATNAPVT